MRPVRELLRLALRLHATYQQRLIKDAQNQQADWERLERRYEEVKRQRQLIEKARAHGWHLAARKQEEDFSGALRACAESVTDMGQQWFAEPDPIPRPADLHAELNHLHEEFDDVRIDGKKKTVAIQTKSIVLEGIALGPFLLRLHWPRLAERADVDCFEVTAIDPHPAENDRSVSHPHVRNRHLCAGDATVPLEKALEQGRLVDAFCLVRSVVETYNSGSAYVALDDWGGLSCWNCGYVVSDDDRYFCDCCEHDLCSDCSSSCQQCDRTLCSSCQTRCDVCEAPCCSRCLQTSACSELSCCANCLKACAVCEAEVASSELDEATGFCPTCQEAQTDREPEASENAVPILTPTSYGESQ